MRCATNSFLASQALSAEVLQSVNGFLRGPREDDALGRSVAWAMLKSFRDGVSRAA